MKLLDLGCGNCHWLQYCTSKGIECTGLTITKEQGQFCNKNFECGLRKSVCNQKTQQCDCNTDDGYEDSNGLEEPGGFCTKSLGKLQQLIYNRSKHFL